MGQKTNPFSFHLGVSRDREAKWFADKDYKETLNEGLHIRDLVAKRLKGTLVSTVGIERAANGVNISVHTAKPDMVIGKGGLEVEASGKRLNTLIEKQVHINIVEVKKLGLDAKLVDDSVARQLEACIAFKRATRQVTQRAMRAGAKDIKVQTAGRLNGAGMAEREWYTEGSVPLHTLRADTDYAWVQALTAYGQIGIKVWINRGEILPGCKDRPVSKHSKGGNKWYR